METIMEDQSTDAEGVVELDSVSNPEQSETEESGTEESATDSEQIVDLDELAATEAEAESESETSKDDPADDEAKDDDEASDDPAPEMRKFDFGGNTLEIDVSKVPAELADKIEDFVKGTWTDYSRKSQVNAETAKTLSAQTAAVAKLSTLNGEALQTYSYGLQLRSEIEQLTAVDMQALWQSNPDQARQLSDTLSNKQAEFQATIAKVGEHETALDNVNQAELARRVAEGTQVLDRRIPKFSTEKVKDVIAYVVAGGVTESDAQQWALNPQMTEYAFKAMLYDRMQSAKGSQPSAKPKPARPVRSVQSSGAAANSSDPDKMSMGQLSKHLGLAS